MSFQQVDRLAEAEAHVARLRAVLRRARVVCLAARYFAAGDELVSEIDQVLVDTERVPGR